jgi:hypothetical protein
VNVGLKANSLLEPSARQMDDGGIHFMPSPAPTKDSVNALVRKAVANFWLVRQKQKEKNEEGGKTDSGSRGAVTGGAHLQGFIDILTQIATNCGFTDSHIFADKHLELPGFFRPTKKWDFVVVKDGRLVAAIELKGQVGPSFGNNFNNRTEEAMGTAKDIWVAFREKRFGAAPAPWLGYFFILEECLKSTVPVKVSEPHFEVGSEFKTQELVGKATLKAAKKQGKSRLGSSYALRYELFCEKLVLERLYSSSALILALRDNPGEYREPKETLSMFTFLTQLEAHLRVASTLTGNQ